MLGGGGLPLNIFLGLIFFRAGLRYFQGGGVEKFSGGRVENIFSVEVTFFREGLAIFWWADLRFFRVGLGII